ncbi:DMT family transporter [Streptomyces sp. HSW2009]|uniref:DMT family transporter n=1 Tax=Streptomyces sp. HSW2009 TaxID=3142890 RepID=UPI0032EEAF8B
MSAPDAPTRRLGVPVLATSMVLLLAVGWVVSGRLVHDNPPLAVAAGRTVTSFLAICAICALRPSSWPKVRVSAGRWRAVGSLAVLGFFVYYTGTLLGVDRIGASRVGLVVSLLPCITFAIGIVAFREQTSTRKVLGTLLAVAAAFGYALDGGSSSGSTSTGALVSGVALALMGTFTYALYGYVYRQHMSDMPPMVALLPVTGVATVLLGLVAVLFVPLGSVGLLDWAGITVLGALLTAPVFLISHELIVRKGPLFTSAVALVVPFLVRLGEWARGAAKAPNLASVLFLLLCSAGVWMTVAARTSPPAAETPGTETPGAKAPGAEAAAAEAPAAPSPSPSPPPAPSTESGRSTS